MPVAAGLDSLRFRVMPAKVLGCPVVRPLLAVTMGSLNCWKITEGDKMRISRRTMLKGAGTLPLAARRLRFSGLAQPAPAAPGAIEIPPILFAHGNGEQAPLWMTPLWRMESNGVPRDRMFAINFTDPSARTEDTKPERNKSSSR